MRKPTYKYLNIYLNSNVPIGPRCTHKHSQILKKVHTLNHIHTQANKHTIIQAQLIIIIIIIIFIGTLRNIAYTKTL